MKKWFKTVVAITMIMSMAFVAFAEPADAAPKKLISGKNAKAIALKNAKLKPSGIKCFKMKYDKEDRNYEIKFYKKKCKVKYSYDISALDGTIMERDIDYKYKKTCSRKKIGKEKAVKKVIKISKLPASVVRAGTCTYRYKKHEGTYQVKFRYGKRVFEYELLAPNGKLKEIEFKYIGKK